MSIQWTLVALFLYAEIILVLLLVLPWISPQKWQRIFKSRFLQALTKQAQWYFLTVISILVLFLLDAVREMRKYSDKDHLEHVHDHVETEMQSNMRLFRAQRNFYISGFSLFLTIVIRKFIILISTEATLRAENEAALKQAKSATSAAQELLAQSSGAGEAAQNSYNEAHQKEINKLNEEVEKLMKDLEKEKVDKEALVSQAKSLETEYDRLTEEHRKLQLKVEGGAQAKKEE